jgi:FkbM family methyltransferase
MIGDQRPGFYVDVGAHHPFRFSNTHLLQKMGWSGINIDATPGSMTLFNEYRPNDVNLELAIGLEEGVLKFDCYNEPALNSFIHERAQHVTKNYFIEKTVEVPVKRLDTVLNEYLPKGYLEAKRFDLLTVDVEGLDFQVIQSFNLNDIRPKYIFIETTSSIEALSNSNVYKYLCENGYKLRSHLYINSLFIDSSGGA